MGHLNRLRVGVHLKLSGRVVQYQDVEVEPAKSMKVDLRSPKPCRQGTPLSPDDKTTDSRTPADKPNSTYSIPTTVTTELPIRHTLDQESFAAHNETRLIDVTTIANVSDLLLCGLKNIHNEMIRSAKEEIHYLHARRWRNRPIAPQWAVPQPRRKAEY